MIKDLDKNLNAGLKMFEAFNTIKEFIEQNGKIEQQIAERTKAAETLRKDIEKLEVSKAEYEAQHAKRMEQADKEYGQAVEDIKVFRDKENESIRSMVAIGTDKLKELKDKIEAADKLLDGTNKLVSEKNKELADLNAKIEKTKSDLRKIVG